MLTVPAGIEIASVEDEAQLETLVKKTFVVITTVGPYCQYGEPIFKLCAQTGTHYLDCTGETPWVARMIKKYEDTAKRSGAIMFPQAGVESAPPDLLTWSMAQHLRKNLSAPTKDAIVTIHKLSYVIATCSLSQTNLDVAFSDSDDAGLSHQGALSPPSLSFLSISR